MKETLLLSLFSLRTAGCSTPFHAYDRGNAARRQCEYCSNWITTQDLSNSVLKLDLHSRFLPEYFPDVCSTGVFHSRVVETLKRERCTGFRAYPMQWDCLEQWIEMMTPKADALEWPVYHRIEILGRVEDDRSEIDPERKIFCPLCRMRPPGSRLDMSKNYRVIPLPGTWYGTDFCAWKGDSGAKSPLCSRRVIDLAARYRWRRVVRASHTGREDYLAHSGELV
jgi:hypothetical protein